MACFMAMTMVTMLFCGDDDGDNAAAAVANDNNDS